jgi:hypothetical protein
MVPSFNVKYYVCNIQTSGWYCQRPGVYLSGYNSGGCQKYGLLPEHTAETIIHSSSNNIQAYTVFNAAGTVKRLNWSAVK